MSRLRTKAGRTIEEMKNGAPEANVDIAGSSDDAADAELLGLTRKSKKKAVNGKRFVETQLKYTFFSLELRFIGRKYKLDRFL